MKTNKEIDIDGKKIGVGNKPYIIAELSANHNGSLDKALEHIEAAASCGADAIKLQTYTPDTMTIDCDDADFRIEGGLWDGYNLYQLYKEAHTPFEWHEALFKKARELGITIFSTPFDETAVDLLEELGVHAYKIASFELTDLPLIKYVAKTGKPIIMSTGMANLVEIEEAVSTAQNNGCKDLVLLHCISSYPAPYEQANLATISDLSARFDVVGGLSDHTLGTAVSVAAVAQGASLIEKHFILDRSEKGPDSQFSIEPSELRQLVTDTEIAYKAIGIAGYERKPVEEANVRFRRSLYVVEDVKAGEEYSPKNVRRIRPGFGLPPKHFSDVIGKRAKKDVFRGTPLSWGLIDNE